MTAAGQRSGGVNNIHVHVSLCSLAWLKEVVQSFIGKLLWKPYLQQRFNHERVW